MTGAKVPLLVAVLLAVACTAPAYGQAAAPPPSLADGLAELRAGRALRIGDRRIDPTPELLGLYGADTLPIWGSNAAADLLAAVRSAVHDGLTPEHYHLTALEAVRPDDARFDLLRTDALVRTRFCRFSAARSRRATSPHRSHPCVRVTSSTRGYARRWPACGASRRVGDGACCPPVRPCAATRSTRACRCCAPDFVARETWSRRSYRIRPCASMRSSMLRCAAFSTVTV